MSCPIFIEADLTRQLCRCSDFGRGRLLDTDGGRFDLLISQTGLRSENQIAALRSHLVKGMSLEDAVNFHEIKSKSNLERDLDKVNQVAEFVVKIENLDWEKFKNGKN